MNLITGVLGVGKTTLVIELLRRKPVHERWAVLVNEYGEVGYLAADIHRRPYAHRLQHFEGGYPRRKLPFDLRAHAIMRYLQDKSLKEFTANGLQNESVTSSRMPVSFLTGQSRIVYFQIVRTNNR